MKLDSVYDRDLERWVGKMPSLQEVELMGMSAEAMRARACRLEIVVIEEYSHS